MLGHAEQSILAILSKKHHLQLDEFKPELLVDGFLGAMEYLNRLREVDASIKYPAFIFNYLPPAGSSIFHPHMQVLVRDRPFYLVDLMLKKSEEYFEENKNSYWSDLLKTEKDGERYLFSNGSVEWLVPFAPLRGLNEVQAVMSGKSSFMEVADAQWRGLAEGISKILWVYHSQGYCSFNIVLASGPMDEHLDYFDVDLRIISRPGVQSGCFSDAWAGPYLLWDGEAVEEPEVFARKVKAALKTT
jgi:galactose-1-phosphate uridylyltransferase